MFKKMILSAIAVIFLSGYPLQAMASSGISVYMDGRNIEFNVPPQLKNGTAMVPMRIIFERLGATINWDTASQSISATKNGTTFKLAIGVKNAYKDETVIPLSEAPVLLDNTTFVPLRFVSEAFGNKVGWLSDSQTITIASTSFEPVRVDRCVDGDNFVGTYLEGSHKKETATFRLIGVNTPETLKPNSPVEFYGPESSRHTKERLTGQTVYVALDKTNDPYARVLVYVFMVDGTFYNAELVSQGYASAMSIEPNIQWKSLFSFLEIEAKNSKKGLWSDQTKTNPPTTTPMQVIDSFFTKKASEYGFSDGTFHPEQLITQDQLLKMIIIAMFPQTKVIFLAESFYKLSQDEQVQQIVKYAIDKGILEKNEIQSSNQPVTVENALTIIARSLKLQETGTNTSMADLGIKLTDLAPSAELTGADAIQLVDRAQQVAEPIKSYISHILEAIKNSRAIESLSSTLKDNSMASQFQGVVDKVKNSASDPGVMTPVKETASSLFSSLSSFIKGGLDSIKEMGILRKIKEYADNATSELKQAQQSLNEAKTK